MKLPSRAGIVGTALEAAGVYPNSTPAFEPIIHNRAAREGGRLLKVVSFNAYGGGNIDAIVACLSRPPLAGATAIFLCEIDWGLTRTQKREVAAELAARLKMSFAFQPLLGFGPDETRVNALFGSAILSAAPVREVRTIPIPGSYELTIGKFRNPPPHHRFVFAPAGLAAEVILRGRRITLGVAHLESHANPAGRERQMAAFLSGFPSSGSAIIGGDFNTTTTELSYRSAVFEVARRMITEPRRFRDPQPHEPLFERLREAGFEADGANVPLRPTFTFTRLIPPLMRPKLDWLTARELSPVAGSAAVIPARRSALSRRISDHDFIVCDFEF